jgi:peptide/nickel transport system substrate-binding protein
MRPLIVILLLCATVNAEARLLRYASQFDPGTMDPHAFATVYNTRVTSQVYDTLVGRDAKFAAEPRLALEWTPLDAGKGWRFKLRPDVKFHDGTPFGADDVVFSIMRAMHPLSAYKSAIPNVTGAKKVDALTVDLLTSKATPVLPLALINLRIMSKAWSEKNHVEKPQDYKGKEESYAARNANGTGPYKLVKWETDIKTVLAKNEHYWGKTGNVTEAQYFVVGSAATRVAALISGEMDIVIDPAVQDLDRLQHSPGLTVQQTVGTGVQYLGFGYGGDSPFKDVRVRQAVRMAIDPGALRSKVMRGTATTTRSLYSPALLTYDKRFDAPWPYDPVRAQALLKEAGYPNGFAVDLDCSAQQPADAICQAVSGMLARAGIRVSHKPLAFNQLIPKLTSGDTTMYVIGWTPATAEPEGALVPLARSKGASGDGEYNFGRYSNPKVDALIDQGRLEFDLAKRTALFTEAMALMDAEAAFIPLVARHATWAMRKNVRAVLWPNDTLELRFVNVD